MHVERPMKQQSALNRATAVRKAASAAARTEISQGMGPAAATWTATGSQKKAKVKRTQQPAASRLPSIRLVRCARWPATRQCA